MSAFIRNAEIKRGRILHLADNDRVCFDHTDFRDCEISIDGDPDTSFFIGCALYNCKVTAQSMRAFNTCVFVECEMDIKGISKKQAGECTFITSGENLVKEKRPDKEETRGAG